MVRLLYSLAWHLALPLVLLRLWWRGRREPGYRRHIGERLGRYPGAGARESRFIWIHAVSVGETRAAEPLVRALLRDYPGCRLLLTHMTPTGRATGASLFGSLGPRLVQCYLPYDMAWTVARFLRNFRPLACVLMETEVWPNLLHECHRQAVPVVLVNARLSERSLRRARKLAALVLPAARLINRVAAQTPEDARRIESLGISHVEVTGSMKFDVEPPAAVVEAGLMLRRQLGATKVLLCASTRDGEEALILDAWRSHPLEDVLLLMVPRHPQRFDEVARLLADRGFIVYRRSMQKDEPVPPASGSRAFLGDSMGEMFAYYAACDLAFVGGSLLPLGGQNLIEACALGKPVLVGPHTFNFAAVTRDAVTAGAAVQAADAQELLAEAARLLADPARREGMGERASQFAARHKGATQRTEAMLAPFLGTGRTA